MSNFTNIFFPPRCCGCDEITETDFPVCEKCKALILHPAKTANRCDICGLSPENCLCGKRQFFDKLCVPFYYEGSPIKTIFKLKFRARPDIAKSYARLLFHSLEERDILKNIDVITFIPMSRFAKFKRGYNQSQLLAEYLSDFTGIPCTQLLYKIGKTSSQHKLKHIERTGNLLGIYEPVKEKIPEIKDKIILITDDVTTTGSTFNELAKTLLIFGADSVYAAACTATKKKKNIAYKE